MIILIVKKEEREVVRRRNNVNIDSLYKIYTTVLAEKLRDEV